MKPTPSSGKDIALTALAPAIWGSTYVVTTELLPPGYPLTAAMLRALPAGLLLLLLARQLPSRDWLARIFLLGTLNFSLFWGLLFVAAYRLPGGVASTVGAMQPLIVVGLSCWLLHTPLRTRSLLAALLGIVGVALLVLTPSATLDTVGLIAGLGSAVSMAFGTVLSRRWRPPVPPLTFTAWQLLAGGILLVPFAMLIEPPLPAMTLRHAAGFLYLGLLGGALTYILWFRGLGRLEPTAVSTLGFLSPLVAILLGWVLLDQTLSPLQGVGIVVVLGSVWLGQRAAMR